MSSLGTDIETFWNNCLDDVSIIEPIPEQWRKYSDFKSTLWSPLPTIDYSYFGISRIEKLQHDPVALNAICASIQAIKTAKLGLAANNKRKKNTLMIENIDTHRAGVFMGSGMGGISSFVENYTYQTHFAGKQALEIFSDNEKLTEKSRGQIRSIMDNMVHPNRMHPMVAAMVMPNTISSSVGIKFSLHGQNQLYASACAAGTVAIGQAFKSIQSGNLDFALAGGSEYLYDEYGGFFRGFDIAKTLVTDCLSPAIANRPFDDSRSGFLFSQGGSAVLVLEDYESACKRNAPIVAEVIGYGETFDAHNVLALSEEGAEIVHMIEMALADAGLKSSNVQYINTHGTGTQINDAVEAKIIEQLFGRNVLVNSSKSLLGHTIGASGAIEAVVAALSIRDQTTHVCHNLKKPIADLNFVMKSESMEIDTALSQSFAFGGHIAGILLKKCNH
jgi:3-oxoacyl-[acyl-carrier-protein] synthase II